jgi:hypothetical protein
MNSIYYAKRSGGSWGTPVLWHTEAASNVYQDWFHNPSVTLRPDGKFAVAVDRIHRTADANSWSFTGFVAEPVTPTGWASDRIGKVYEMSPGFHDIPLGGGAGAGGAGAGWEGVTSLAHRWERTAPVIHAEGKLIFHHSLELIMEVGVGIDSGQGSDPQVMIEWSNDAGRTWSSERWASMGKVGEYARRLIFRQLGQSRNRVYRLAGSDPVRTCLVEGYVEAEIGTS